MASAKRVSKANSAASLGPLAKAGAIIRGVNPAVLAESLRPSKKASESDFQDRVILLAQALGYAVAHFRKVRVQRANGSVYYETPVAADGKGFLDLELVRFCPPRLIKAELKSATGRIEPEQREWVERYEAVGIECYVWRPKNWDDIVAVLSRK
jgi:hypothetical protein